MKWCHAGSKNRADVFETRFFNFGEDIPLELYKMRVIRLKGQRTWDAPEIAFIFDKSYFF